MTDEIKFEYPELGEKSKNVIFKISKKAKCIRITIHSLNQIKVTVPRRAKIEDAQQFFQSKIIWVANNLIKLQGRSIRNSLESKAKLTSQEFLERNQYLITRCQYFAKKHHFQIGKILLRRQKSIWGSCSAQNNISLNANLVFLSDELIDYVILHELVHTKVKNHSKKFWNKLEELLPGAKSLDQKLKNYQPNFHIG